MRSKAQVLALGGGWRFRDLPIRQKLIVIIIMTTTFGLVLSGAGLIFADSYFFRGFLERDLSTLARILADNSTASLEFNEAGSARETLAALRERSQVIAACIYRLDNSVLASYTRLGETAECSPASPGYQVQSSHGTMTVSQPIMLKGQRVGTITLRYDLSEISDRVHLHGTTVLAVLVISSFAAFLFSSRLRASVARPILDLAHATTSVAATKDYSIRAQRHSKDELGLLVDAFNEMLSGIQSRDSNLTKALVDREEALQQARSARDFLRTTLASIGDAVISADMAGRVLFANPVALALLRRTEAETTGRFVSDVFPVIDASSRESVENPVARVLVEGSASGTADHTLVAAADGTEIPVDYSGAPILTQAGETVGVVLIFRDMTERQRAEQERKRLSEEMLATKERLRETAKLESLGVLAGGIAHDFNNLLVGILGNASLAEEMLRPTHAALPVVQNVIGAAERAAQLTHQMLAYSGKGRFVIERVNLSEAVDGILPLITRPIPKSVAIKLNLETHLPAIEADKSQLQQILMNLVINAAEACGAKGGSVSITTSRVELESGQIPPSFGMEANPAGRFVCLEVKDTGSGMPDEVKAKIFDPFFTTKFTGRGLGLSAVLGIIRSHKGAVEVESALGVGTTFRVYFPIIAGDAEAEEKKSTAAGAFQGTGTVLVVDDEAVVRTMAKSALEAAGYHVLLAEDGEVGVRRLTQFADRISLVILDLTMPVLDGESALAQMKRIDPAVKVLLSSGFDEMELAERFKGKGLAGFLKKPYTSTKLLYEVRVASGHAMRADSQSAV